MWPSRSSSRVEVSAPVNFSRFVRPQSARRFRTRAAFHFLLSSPSPKYPSALFRATKTRSNPDERAGGIPSSSQGVRERWFLHNKYLARIYGMSFSKIHFIIQSSTCARTCCRCYISQSHIANGSFTCNSNQCFINGVDIKSFLI